MRRLVEDGIAVGLSHQAGIEIEEKIEAPVGFGVVDGTGHKNIGGVVIAFGFDQAAVESGQFGVEFSEGLGEELEFFATAAFDEGATDEVIDGLVAGAVADGFHHAADPWAGEGVTERDLAGLEEVEDELEMLQFLDGDGVEFFDVGIEILVFFEAKSGGGGFSFEVCVVDQNSGQIGFNFIQPVGGRFGAEHQHVEAM